MSEDWTQHSETRRTMLKYLGVAAGIGVVGGGVADPFAHPVTALQSDEDSFTTEDIEVESFDGTTLATTIYEPEAEGPHPAVLMTHGWGGSREDMQPLASVYASREFVVLTYDSRGFGESGGQVQSIAEEEQRDTSELITWLAGRASVLTDGEENPRVGMDGVSYGGGTQLRAAAFDDRLDAIVPRATWYNNAQALVPNGVVKSGWLRALDLGARQQDPTGDLAQDIIDQFERIIATGEATEQDRQTYRENSPVTYPEIDVPTLIIPEWTDELFPSNQGVDIFRKVQQSGTDTSLIIGQDGTHIIGPPADVDSYPPGFDTSQLFTTGSPTDPGAAVQWLEAYLKGDGDPEFPTVQYYDVANDEFQTAEEFPPYEEQTLTHSFEEAVQLDGGEGNVATIDRQMTEQTELVGIPTLSLTVTPTGEGPSHLFASVQRVRDDQTKTLKEQVTPYAVEEEGEIEFDLHGVQAQFQSGDVLRIALSAREDDLSAAQVSAIFGGSLYVNTPEGSGVEIQGGTNIEFSVSASGPLMSDDDDTSDGGDDDMSDGGDDDTSDGGDDDTSDGGDGDTSDGSDGDMSDGSDGDTSDGSDGDMSDGSDGDMNDGGDEDGSGGGTEDNESEESSDDGGPGFGIPAAAGGAGGLAYLLRRRFGSGSKTTDAQADNGTETVSGEKTKAETNSTDGDDS